MTMINIKIYDPEMCKCYDLTFSAANYKDAFAQAETKVKPWGHVVRGIGSNIKMEGKRV